MKTASLRIRTLTAHTSLACRTIVLSLVASLTNIVVAAPPPLLVDHFDDGIQNELAGYRNTFERAPSTAKADRVENIFRGPVGLSARLEGHRHAEGYCGYWLHFFDMRAAQKKYFDSRAYGYLSFWIRGEKGGEEVLVKVADQRWVEKEDAVAVGRVTDFLRKGITTDWQEVLIPVNRQSQLDWTKLGALVFEFDKPGNWVVYVDDVCFKGNPALESEPPRTVPSRSEPAPIRTSADLPHKLWVWNTHQVLRNEASGRELLDFCQQKRIGEIWLQVLYGLEMDRDGTSGSGHPGTVRRIELRQADDLRQFLRAAHAREIKVHALDGYPEFAQREFHKVPLGLVDVLIEFNAAAEPAERFDGIHFDNEPYLLLGWHEPVRRKEILREFLELNAECQRRVRAGSAMKFGVDIPFWFQERDDASGQITGEVEFRGKTQPASFHCIDLLDNVGIMNYRDTADGADGMISHGRDLLEYADRVGGASVYMGVETFKYQPIPVWFCRGLPRSEFGDALAGVAQDFARLSRLNDYRFRTLDDGSFVHIGIEVPSPLEPQARKLATETLIEIARRFRLPDLKNSAFDEESLAATAEAVNANPEWESFQPLSIVDEKSDRSFAGFMANNVMLGKITFADDTYDEMRKELSAADSLFRKYQHYGGIAIHYYETFRDKTRDK